MSHMHLTHPHVPHAPTCTSCTHTYLMHPHAPLAPTRTTCTHMYLFHPHVPPAPTRTSCTHTYLMHPHIPHAPTRTSCTHMCPHVNMPMHTHVDPRTLMHVGPLTPPVRPAEQCGQPDGPRQCLLAARKPVAHQGLTRSQPAGGPQHGHAGRVAAAHILPCDGSPHLQPYADGQGQYWGEGRCGGRR